MEPAGEGRDERAQGDDRGHGRRAAMEPAREGRDDSGIIVQPFTYQGVPQWSPPEEAGHLTRSTLMNWPQSPPQWSPPVSCGDGQFRVMRMHRYSVMPQCSPPV